MNKVILTGNLTKAITKKNLDNGICVAESSLAVNYRGNKNTETCYIDLVVYGSIANVLYQYAKIGIKLLVEGRLKQDIWKDSKGATKNKHYIVVERIEFLANKKDKK